MKRFVYCFGTILVCAFNFLLSADTFAFSSETTVRVYGKVTDESGEPVPEATVMFISQTDTTSTLTDTSGMYLVRLSPESTHVCENTSPDIFLLHQNYPNPFNPGTVIQYELKRSAHVKLDIYNISGQVVRSLRDNLEGPGIHSVQWDGRDNGGKGVSAGVYLYRLQTDGFSQTKKMVLLDGGVDGQVSSGSYVGERPVSKVVKKSEYYYEITVEKEGFKTYSEEEFIIPDAIIEVEKNFILNKMIENKIYSLKVQPTWLRSYIGGGGLFLIELIPGNDFSGNVQLSLDIDPCLQAEFTTDLLSNENRVSELTIRPDSTVTFGIRETEWAVEHGHYIIVLTSKHLEKSERHILDVIVIKDVYFQIEYAHNESIRRILLPFLQWIENEHKEIGIEQNQEWINYFAYDGCQVLGDLYPAVTGSGTKKYLSPEWDITEYGEIHPPGYTWFLIRKRGDVLLLFAAKKIGKNPYFEIPVSEFPFSYAFWYDYNK